MWNVVSCVLIVQEAGAPWPLLANHAAAIFSKWRSEVTCGILQQAMHLVCSDKNNPTWGKPLFWKPASTMQRWIVGRPSRRKIHTTFLHLVSRRYLTWIVYSRGKEGLSPSLSRLSKCRPNDFDHKMMHLMHAFINCLCTTPSSFSCRT